MELKIIIELHHYHHYSAKADSTTPQPGNTPPAPAGTADTLPAEVTARLSKCLNEGYERLSHARAPKTLQNYDTALRSFSAYMHSTAADAPADEATLMQGYEHWLRSRGVCLNTSSCYMRSLRALIRQGGADDPALASAFGGVYTGRSRTGKRAVPVETIARLRALKLKPGSALCLARDIFLFSFYALGMPFVDVAFLRRQQVADGQIVYYRRKTGQRIVVALEPCMTDIIARYATAGGDYVFPVISATDAEEAQAEYRRKLSKYNRQLRRLSALLPGGCRLTSYVVRHTWASAAYHGDIALPVISKALGHCNANTTMTYIRDIDDERLIEANRRLLSQLDDTP